MTENTRTLVLFAYYESALSRENLTFFCQCGVFADAEIRYVFIINGGECSVNIPPYDNVVVLRRENVGFDFGAWAHGLGATASSLDTFNTFVFLNGSVTGPFLPSYIVARSWIDVFRQRLNDRVKLVGTTINTHAEPYLKGPHPHVQSMFFVTDRIGLDLLQRGGIFTGTENDTTKEATIVNRELRTSLVILEAKYEIDCMLPGFQGVSYRNLLAPRAAACRTLSEITANPAKSDRYFAGRYWGYDIEPLDVVFFKTNRSCATKSLEKYCALVHREAANRADRIFTDRIRKSLAYLKSYAPSAWKGHLEFAVWLVARFQPRIIVDLGVDYGHSTFAWALPGIGEVTGVDWFQGDTHAGSRDTLACVQATYQHLQECYGLHDIVRVQKSTFSNAAARFTKEVDILHIDGLHATDAVRNDFETWFPKLAHGGLVLFHDIASFADSVGAYFRSLPFHKTEFQHSAGLGILSTDAAKLDIIEREWKLALEDRGMHLMHRVYDLEIQKSIG